MDFSKLFHDTPHCDCLEDCCADCSNIYVRAIDGPELKMEDFHNYWDGGRTATQCDTIAKFKGVSVSKLEFEEDKIEVLLKYKQQFGGVSRNYKGYACLFRPKTNAGLFKYTPSKENKRHHTFYTSDIFNLQQLEIIGIFNLQTDV